MAARPIRSTKKLSKEDLLKKQKQKKDNKNCVKLTVLVYVNLSRSYQVPIF